MNAIFTDNEEDMRKLLVNITKKDIRQRIKKDILSNTSKIYQQLLNCKNVEMQIAVMNIMLRALTKDEIRNNKLLGAHNKAATMIQRGNRASLLHFLKEFACIENECKVAGAEVEIFVVREREIRGGYLFMGVENFRFQKDTEVVIIQFRSIVGVTFTGRDLIIIATEDRKVNVRFMYEQDIVKLREMIVNRFGQVEAEESIVVEIGKKVTFSPEVEVRISDEAETRVDEAYKREDNEISDEEAKVSSDRKTVKRKSVKQSHTTKRLKKYKKRKKSRKQACFVKERPFTGLSKKAHEIYRDKLKLAKLVYQLMKSKAKRFKRTVEEFEKQSVYRIE